MMPSLTHFTPWQPPSTATNSDALLLARGFERRIAAISRRLVDRVDEVDVVGLLKDVLHRLAAAFRRALGHVGADDLRAVAHRVVLRILDRDAEAGRGSHCGADSRRWAGWGRDRAWRSWRLGLVAERALRPLADQFAGLEVVGGEIGVGGRRSGSSGVSSVMTRMPALRAFFDRRHDRGRIARHEQDALGAGGDQLLDRPRPRRHCRRRTCRRRLAA